MYHAQGGCRGERQLLVFCGGCDGLPGGSGSPASGEATNGFSLGHLDVDHPLGVIENQTSYN